MSNGIRTRQSFIDSFDIGEYSFEIHKMSETGKKYGVYLFHKGEAWGWLGEPERYSTKLQAHVAILSYLERSIK